MQRLMAKNITQLHWLIINIIAASASLAPGDPSVGAKIYASASAATTTATGSTACIDEDRFAVVTDYSYLINIIL